MRSHNQEISGDAAVNQPSHSTNANQMIQIPSNMGNDNSACKIVLLCGTNTSRAKY